MSFKEYLHEQKLRESTVNEHLQDVNRFKKWCDQENTCGEPSRTINHKNASYNDLLKFIQAAQARQVSKSSINLHLNSIQKYYNFVILNEVRNLLPTRPNPAQDLRLQNSGKKVIQPIAIATLEKIYHDYANKPPWKFREKKTKQVHERNVVLLGLLIYQGIQTAELNIIEINHLNLSQGKIYIPSTTRSNSRILSLQAQQMVAIQKYLQQEQNESNNGKLFKNKASIVIKCLLTALKKEQNTIHNAQQIRSSVIMNWLKQQNIRQVQYMAGHKWISSTEKYKQEDLADLQNALKQHHPLR